jgi:hypothetical protein
MDRKAKSSPEVIPPSTVFCTPAAAPSGSAGGNQVTAAPIGAQDLPQLDPKAEKTARSSHQSAGSQSAPVLKARTPAPPLVLLYRRGELPLRLIRRRNGWRFCGRKDGVAHDHRQKRPAR